jgi:hypothetical protein
MASTKFDTIHNDEPVCPHCGFVQPDMWNIGEGSYEEECQRCGRKFKIETCVEVTYSTYCIDGEHQWGEWRESRHCTKLRHCTVCDAIDVVGIGGER